MPKMKPYIDVVLKIEDLSLLDHSYQTPVKMSLHFGAVLSLISLNVSPELMSCHLTHELNSFTQMPTGGVL